MKYGEFVVLFCTVYLLRDNLALEYLYLVGCALNIMLKGSLKRLFKERRPHQESTDTYGFPSGHAQNLSFSLTFLYLVHRTEWWNHIHFLSIVAILTMVERYSVNKHTWSQLVGGLMVGTMFAYMFVYTLSVKSSIVSPGLVGTLGGLLDSGKPFLQPGHA
jgi:membrane-associated phospholipid phosphatase